MPVLTTPKFSTVPIQVASSINPTLSVMSTPLVGAVSSSTGVSLPPTTVLGVNAPGSVLLSSVATGTGLVAKASPMQITSIPAALSTPIPAPQSASLPPGGSTATPSVNNQGANQNTAINTTAVGATPSPEPSIHERFHAFLAEYMREAYVGFAEFGIVGGVASTLGYFIYHRIVKKRLKRRR